jgi:hypothetical protein
MLGKKLSGRNEPFLKNGLRKLCMKKTPFIEKQTALKKLSEKNTVYKKPYPKTIGFNRRKNIVSKNG